MNPLEKLKVLQQEAGKQRVVRDQKFTTQIYVGTATCENAAGAREVYQKISSLIQATPKSDLYLGLTGCTGRCDQEPLVQVITKDHVTVYCRMNPEKIEKVFSEHVLGARPVQEWVL